MPYLDGTPAPGDKTGAQIGDAPTSIQLEITEPEEMIAKLLAFIYSVNGRKIAHVGVEWYSDADGSAPFSVNIESSMYVKGE